MQVVPQMIRHGTGGSGAGELRLLVLTLLFIGFAGCGLFGSEDTTPPEPPAGLEATSEDAAIALDWSAVQSDDVAGYNVYRSTSSIGDVSSREPINRSEPVAEAGYTDQSVSNGTTYRYVVTSVDEAGNESNPSEEIEKTPFSEPPNRP